MMDDVLIQAREICLADDRLRMLMGDRLEALDQVQVTACEIDGKPLFFATDMELDPIQRLHRTGAFAKPDELELMQRYLPKGGMFLDIGAHVGNHSLFAGLFCAAQRIIPFEPNPAAYQLLILNLVLNGLHDRAEFDYLGFGASDLDREGVTIARRHPDLGAARMVPGEGQMSTLRADDFLHDETPGMIKIDVGGTEMDVLRGLQKTIKRSRPVMLVEVERQNIPDFADWRLAHGFALPNSLKHHDESRDFLCVPQERLNGALPPASPKGRGAVEGNAPRNGGRSMRKPIRLYYWPAPNFGDALSHLIVEHVSGRPVINARPKQAEIFSLGSVMHVVSRHWSDHTRGEGPLLWGTGLLNPFYRKDFLDNVRVRLLRGPISAAFLRLKMDEFGDPGLLADAAIGPISERHDRVAIIPHHSQMEDPRFVDMVEADPAFHLIDVRQDPVTVCRDIAASAHVFSASLHGLIVADAYGVANTWMDPETQGRLKYHDYAASIGRDLIAPVAIDDVPRAARAARDGSFPYAEGIARCRESLLKHFPDELRAGANKRAVGAQK